MTQGRPAAQLTHFRSDGAVHMVEVGQKPTTLRRARARARVRLAASVLAALARNPKGSPFEIARIAGIAGAKRTAELIPLCHPLALTGIEVDVRRCRGGIEIVASVTTSGPTGVEMEALTAVSVAALTVYDMCKALDKGIEIREIVLLSKEGGKSGTYRRQPTRPAARRAAGKGAR